MINPHEILDKEFSRQVRGYNINEVDDFLDEIVVEVQALYRDNGTLKAKIENLEDKLKHYQDIERALQDTLIMAQSAAQTAKEQAARDAEAILSEAKASAARIAQNTEVEHASTVSKLQRSKIEFENYRRRVLSFMESQMLAFDATSREIGGSRVESLSVSPPPPQVYDFDELTPQG